MFRLYIRFYFALLASLFVFLVATAMIYHVVAMPHATRMQAYVMVGRNFHIVLMVTATAIAAGAYPLVRQISRRLERLQRGVESLGAGDLSARVPVEGRDEVARLAGSFNTAAARIEQLVKANKALLANASHELRTPLARIRLAVELVKDAADPKRRLGLEQDIAELDWLVDEILLASRLDTVTDAPDSQEVDLLALAAEECARYDGAQLEGAPGLIRGDPGSCAGCSATSWRTPCGTAPRPPRFESHVTRAAPPLRSGTPGAVYRSPNSRTSSARSISPLPAPSAPPAPAWASRSYARSRVAMAVMPAAPSCPTATAVLS